MARSPRQLIVAAALCALAFAGLLAAIYFSWRVRVFDANAMGGFLDAQRPWLVGATTRVAELCDPDAVAVFGALLAAIAFARGRPRQAAAVVFLVTVTSVSSQLLKAVLDYPRYEAVLSVAEVKSAAFPSGHATAAMTLALCGVLVAPPTARRLAAVAGALFALAVSYSLVSLGWHFPSDVAGGFLVATGWTLVVLAGLQVAARRWPERTVRSGLRTALASATERVTEVGLLAGLMASLVAAGLVATALVLFRLPELLAWTEARTTAAFVACALAACAVALLAFVTRALPRRR